MPTDRLRRSAADGHAQDAWSGTVGELEAIVEVAATLLQEREQATRQEFDAETQVYVAERVSERSEFTDAETEAQRANELRDDLWEKRRQQFRVTLKAVESNSQKLEGSPSEVLNAMDRRVVVRLEVHAPPYGLYDERLGRIVVEFDRNAPTSISISGDDPGWVDKGIVQLRREWLRANLLGPGSGAASERTSPSSAPLWPY